ncbi:MAG: IS4 family transposase [Eubacteriales bacterium]
MFDVNLKIISELKSFLQFFISDNQLVNAFSFSDSDFIRTRKLPFNKVAILIAKLCKKTLSVELESFFNDIQSDSCSVSAFSQQRSKLNPLFFDYWNQVLTSSFYYYGSQSVKRWNSFRIIAADGSNISLINNKALSEFFGGQRNQYSYFVQAKTFYHYDVLNELIVLSNIKPYKYGEMKMAHEAIKHLEEDMLTIYDRNFGNYKMIALHLWQERERKFVIRGNERYNWIKQFILSGETSSLVTIYPTIQMVKNMRESGFIVTDKTKLVVRLVRVELEKSVEVLITNLWEEEGYKSSEFKALYNMRWGVETNISIQKNILQLESFSGLTVTSVMQDFYATILITNLHSVIIKDAEQTIQERAKESKRKYPVKVNKNKSFGKLKLQLVKLFTTQDPESILQLLHTYFIKEVVPIRKGRSFPRVRKNVSTKSKFKTYSNFKPAY